MCRLFGFRANEPTRIECGLVVAQNSLVTQGIRDREGLSHGNGWGFAAYRETSVMVEKQAWAAWEGEHFKKSVANTYATTVIAHVRRATVGPPTMANTHPFVHGLWSFAHNGTVKGFDDVRPRLLEQISPLHRSELHGDTDSEHIFRYLLTLWSAHPERDLMETLRVGLQQVVAWSAEAAPGERISLNVLWSNGEQLVGSRLNRTLWFLERGDVIHCDVCGQPHVKHDHNTQYRSVDIASEPITGERWLGVPNGSVFTVDPDLRLRIEPLGIPVELVDGAVA